MEIDPELRHSLSTTSLIKHCIPGTETLEAIISGKTKPEKNQITELSSAILTDTMKLVIGGGILIGGYHGTVMAMDIFSRVYETLF